MILGILLFLNFVIWLTSSLLVIMIEYNDTKNSSYHKFDVSGIILFSFISMIPIANIGCLVFTITEIVSQQLFNGENII